jgi:hypothetical protein
VCGVEGVALRRTRRRPGIPVTGFGHDGAVSHSRLRQIADPFVVPAPNGARVRTRIAVSVTDEMVLWAAGEHLGRLAGADLADRCRLGCATDNERKRRKQALTAAASSRWAGALTRTSNDQWKRGWANL